MAREKRADRTLLVDTDVLIWHLRGYPKATRRLDQLPKLTISVITYLELLQGLRNRAEMLALQKSLEMRNTERLAITPSITERAVALMEELALSHGLQLGDAFIAATSLEHGITVLTGNTKHFSPIVGVHRALRAVKCSMLVFVPKPGSAPYKIEIPKPRFNDH